MSTRGIIAIKEDNGVYKYVYNHYDSYLEGLGVMLKQNYTDVDKIRELINLGNLSSVGATLENNSQTYEEHMELPQNQRGTVSYFRDANRWEDFRCGYCEWEKEKPNETLNINEICKNDFVYVYDVNAKEWNIAYWETYNNGNEAKFYNLTELLHDRKLLDEFLGEDYFSKQYKETMYQKMLNS